VTALRQRLHEMAGGLPRPDWFMWAGTFVTRCGSFVLPYLAIVLTRDRGLAPTAAGSIVALDGAGAALAAPLGGTLADKVGRRATLLLALFGGGAGMIALGFVSDMRAFAPLLFSVALLTEMYRPGMQAAVADLVPPQDRVRAFGLTYWVINLGYAIGVTLGGVVAGHSFRWLFVGDGLATMLFGALIAIGVPETRPAAARVAADASAAPRESRVGRRARRLTATPRSSRSWRWRTCTRCCSCRTRRRCRSI
jgi:MFS family permease